MSRAFSATAPRRRASTEVLAGRERSAYLAGRIDIGIRDGRLATGLSQAQASQRAGISQPMWSRLERGAAAHSTLETIATCSAVVGTQFAAFIEARPGASMPRDIEHLRRQELMIDFARPGGWTARPERLIDPDARRSRSIDVELVRSGRREIAVVEIEDLLGDGGAAMRGLGDKVAVLRHEVGPGWAVSGLLVLRATHRNRQVVSSIKSVLVAPFPASPSAWLAALHDPARAMPLTDGIVWSTVDGKRLMPARLR